MRVPELALYSRGVDLDGYAVVTWACPECEITHIDDHEINENAVRCCVCGADFVLVERQTHVIIPGGGVVQLKVPPR